MSQWVVREPTIFPVRSTLSGEASWHTWCLSLELLTNAFFTCSWLLQSFLISFFILFCLSLFCSFYCYIPSPIFFCIPRYQLISNSLHMIYQTIQHIPHYSRVHSIFCFIVKVNIFWYKYWGNCEIKIKLAVGIQSLEWQNLILPYRISVICMEKVSCY